MREAPVRKRVIGVEVGLDAALHAFDLGERVPKLEERELAAVDAAANMRPEPLAQLGDGCKKGSVGAIARSLFPDRARSRCREGTARPWAPTDPFGNRSTRRRVAENSEAHGVQPTALTTLLARTADEVYPRQRGDSPERVHTPASGSLPAAP